MKRAFISIIILGLILFGAYWFIDQEKFSREDILSAETLKTLRGRVYSAPENSPFKDFFIDDHGNLYGLEAANDYKQINELEQKIEQLADSGQEVELKGEIKQGVNDYGNKRVEVREAEPITASKENYLDSRRSIEAETSSSYNQGVETCQNQGGGVELIRMCIFPNGEQCDLESLINNSCP